MEDTPPNLTLPTDDWRRRVVCDPAICHGRPTIRGTRVSVAVLAGSLADMTVDELLAECPQITREDVAAAVEFRREQPDRSLCD